MEGFVIVRKWQEWKDSEEGRKALNPYTLGNNTARAHEYLENRLESAFQAGIKAAEVDAEARAAKRNIESFEETG